MLSGYKTYATAAIGAAVGFATAVGWIDTETGIAISTGLIALMGAFLRAGVKKESQ